MKDINTEEAFTTREVSSSDGSPAVEINIRKSDEHGDIKYQKIHFVKGDNS